MARKAAATPRGVNGNVVRCLFPLTVPEPVVAEAVDILRAAFRAAAA